MGVLFHFAFLFLSIAGLESCGKLPGYEVSSKTDAFTADVQLNPNIDMLFVIDNSGSMADNQTTIANSFQSFIDQFSDKGLQFHIGVITTDQFGNTVDTYGLTDVIHPGNPSALSISNWWNPNGSGTCVSHHNCQYKVDNTTSGVAESIFNHGYGSLLTKYAGETFLTPDSLDFVNKFKNNAHLGINGSGSEMPLMSIKTALQPSSIDVNVNPSAYNKDFIRSDAFLAVIVVTDEDEAIQVGFNGSGGDTEYLHNAVHSVEEAARINLAVNTLKGIKGVALDNFSLSVIGAPAGDTDCDGIVDTRSITLQRTIDQINNDPLVPPLGNGAAKAKMLSICQPFDDDLLKIGSDIIEANARYNLVQPPADPANIIVTVNGVPVPRTTTNGWEYFGSENYVQFFGTAVPASGDHIGIDYVPGAPI